MTLSELQKQLDTLTQKNYEDLAGMRSISADLTASAYMIEAVHQMLDAIEVRKLELAQRIAGMLPAPPMASQIDEERDTRAFVGRVASHVRQDEIGSDEDLERIVRNLRRHEAAE